MADYNPTDTLNLVQRTTIFDDDLDEEKRGFNDVAKQFVREFNATDEFVIDRLSGLGSVILAGVASITANGAGLGLETVTLPVVMASADYAVFMTADGTAGSVNALSAEDRTTTEFVIRANSSAGITFNVDWMVVF